MSGQELFALMYMNFLYTVILKRCFRRLQQTLSLYSVIFLFKDLKIAFVPLKMINASGLQLWSKADSLERKRMWNDSMLNSEKVRIAKYNKMGMIILFQTGNSTSTDMIW